MAAAVYFLGMRVLPWLANYSWTSRCPPVWQFVRMIHRTINRAEFLSAAVNQESTATQALKKTLRSVVSSRCFIFQQTENAEKNEQPHACVKRDERANKRTNARTRFFSFVVYLSLFYFLFRSLALFTGEFPAEYRPTTVHVRRINLNGEVTAVLGRASCFRKIKRAPFGLFREDTGDRIKFRAPLSNTRTLLPAVTR